MGSRTITELRNPVFLGALAVLLLNDWVLKAIVPGLITGKLSDVAGLFALGYFAAALCPAQWRSYLLCGVATAFAYWKSPLAEPLLDLFNTVGPLTWSRTVDPTDLLALPVLCFVPPALALRFFPAPALQRAPIALVAIAAFVATSAAPVELSFTPGAWEYAVSDSQRAEVVRRATTRGWLVSGRAPPALGEQFDLRLRHRDYPMCGVVTVEFVGRGGGAVLAVRAVNVEDWCVGKREPAAVRLAIERAFLSPLLTGAPPVWPP